MPRDCASPSQEFMRSPEVLTVWRKREERSGPSSERRPDSAALRDRSTLAWFPSFCGETCGARTRAGRVETLLDTSGRNSKAGVDTARTSAYATKLASVAYGNSKSGL